MSSATIMLARNLNLKKLTYPCVATEKLDGVPGVFTGMSSSCVSAVTRQGEDILSVDHIRRALYAGIPVGHQLIGELHIPGMDFKDISGLVRRHEPCPKLILNVWDYYTGEELSYAQRMEQLVVSELGKGIYDYNGIPICVIPGTHIRDEAALIRHCHEHTELNPNSEGLIFRPLHGEHSVYRPGKRSWGLQRFKAEETVDLRVIGFKEAVEVDTKAPKGMVGRIICDYNGAQIGIGPGALTHAERIDIWCNQRDYIYSIVEVAYKPDPSYEALREARFKRWRDDKTEPNVE